MSDRIDSPRPPDHLSIVIGLDFTEQDGPAFDQSARLAQYFPRRELHLVHVLDAEPPPARARAVIDRLRLYVTERATSMVNPGGITVGIHLCWGDVVNEIVELAKDVGADLIVLGSREGSAGRGAVGEKAARLMAGASCPVLVAGAAPALRGGETRDDDDSPRVRAGRRRITHELEGGASGALAGAVVGAGAGPPGMLAGAIFGSFAGAMAGAVLDGESQRRYAHDRQLDAEVTGPSAGSRTRP